MVLSRHFLPPLAINAFLGTILFQSYTGISTALSDACPDHSSIIIAAASGAAAGAIQSVIGAPADNVRILLENGSLHGSLGGHSGWRDAWKVIFKGPETLDPRPESLRVDGTQPNGTARTSLRHQARDAKRWMNEVKGMAGRGWDGWGWGCAKDVVGAISLFPFTLFSVIKVAMYA